MFKIKTLAVSLAAAALVACGGGGGGGTDITKAEGAGSVFLVNAGSAAIGAAMSNATIAIQSLPASLGDEIQLTASEAGAFTVPAGTKLPALVKATSANQQYTYFGYIKSADQVGVPVNPITTTLLTLAVGGHPTSIKTVIDETDLAEARTKTASLFQLLLAATNQSAETDFLSKTFTTDHTGLDLVLDSVGLQLSNNGGLVVANKLTGVITSVEKSNITPIAFDAAAINRMKNLPIQLCANFLDGLTSQALTKDVSIYDTNFLESGRSRDIYMAEFEGITTSDFKVSMPVFAGLDANENLTFDIQLGNASTKEYITDYRLTVKKHASSNKCVLVGDQYPFEITIQPAIKSLVRVDGLTSNAVEKFSGIEIYVGAHSEWSFARNNVGSDRIKSARVDICNSTGACSNLATLTNSGGAERGIFDIDGSLANNSFRMLKISSVNLFSDISNPIKITFFSSDSAPLTGVVNSLGSVHARSSAPAFTSAEVVSIEMPSVANSSILSEVLSNPTLSWSSGSGVISEIGLDSRSSNYSSNDSKLLLKKGAGSTTLKVSDQANPTYKSLSVTAHISTRPGMLETKYIWVPSCSQCY